VMPWIWTFARNAFGEPPGSLAGSSGSSIETYPRSGRGRRLVSRTSSAQGDWKRRADRGQS
jgi:hypothetical protein